MSKETINDCPFCFSDEVGMGDTASESGWVVCDGCGAEGPLRVSHEQAIKDWNTPTHDMDLLKKDCDRLRRELDECQGVIR